VIAGRYSLDSEIARGGMGAVWLGRDEVLGRRVALKRVGGQPWSAGNDPAVDLARAEREARLAARLDHPNVVAIFNFVVDPETDDRWLVMEYVPGSTLAQLVEERGRLSPDEAAPLLVQAADALAAAHSAGIVHRDVKPSNVLVDPDGRVKLTDFGIARAAADPSLTQTGLVTGSPAYLAPEVAAGGRADEAADVWSLGATAFHVLSGRPPYEIGDHVLGGLYRIVNEEPPRPSGAGWLGPLLEATMVKEPSLRWSMVEVRDFLSGGSAPPARNATTAPTLHTAGPPRRGPRRSPSGTVYAGLGAAALAVVVALVLLTVLPGRGPAEDTAGSPSEGPAGTGRGAPPASPGTDSGTGPTVQGMRSFVRDYVAALSADPGAAWRMLTPEFQRESGGLDTYREFWAGVGEGRILALSADPRTLVVRYRVDFENFGTGRRPTVLELAFDDGRYRIADELTEEATG
jgi:eukaryotic-like serine/threonine-protein kinase